MAKGQAIYPLTGKPLAQPKNATIVLSHTTEDAPAKRPSSRLPAYSKQGIRLSVRGYRCQIWQVTYSDITRQTNRLAQFLVIKPAIAAKKCSV